MLQLLVNLLKTVQCYQISEIISWWIRQIYGWKSTPFHRTITDGTLQSKDWKRHSLENRTDYTVKAGKSYVAHVVSSGYRWGNWGPERWRLPRWTAAELRYVQHSSHFFELPLWLVFSDCYTIQKLALLFLFFVKISAEMQTPSYWLTFPLWLVI